jgi:hypothetical protein
MNPSKIAPVAVDQRLIEPERFGGPEVTARTPRSKGGLRPAGGSNLKVIGGSIWE